MRPIEPVTIAMLNGEEREFLLSMASVRRLKQRFGVTQIGELMQRDAEECGVPVLWEALQNKRIGETEATFAEVLPANLSEVIEAVARLFGASFPDPHSPNPTKTTETTTQIP